MYPLRNISRGIRKLDRGYCVLVVGFEVCRVRTDCILQQASAHMLTWYQTRCIINGRDVGSAPMKEKQWGIINRQTEVPAALSVGWGLRCI